MSTCQNATPVSNGFSLSGRLDSHEKRDEMNAAGRKIQLTIDSCGMVWHQRDRVYGGTKYRSWCDSTVSRYHDDNVIIVTLASSLADCEVMTASDFPPSPCCSHTRRGRWCAHRDTWASVLTDYDRAEGRGPLSRSRRIGV